MKKNMMMNKTNVLVLIVLLSGLAFLGGACQRQPFQNGRYSILLRDVNKTDYQEVVNAGFPVDQPTINPAGTKIAYVSFTADTNGDGAITDADVVAADVVVVDFDGRHQMSVADTGTAELQPVWRDNDTLIYAAKNGQQYDLFSVRSDSSQKTNITDTTDVSEQDPYIRGDWLLYRAEQKLDGKLVSGINALNLASGETKTITSPAFNDESAGTFAFGDYRPVLSPDERQVYFTRHLDDDLIIADTVVGRYDVYTVPFSGVGVEQVLIASQGRAWSGLDISPDGQVLAVSEFSESVFSTGDIWLYRLGDGQMQNISNLDKDYIFESSPRFYDKNNDYYVLYAAEQIVDPKDLK